MDRITRQAQRQANRVPLEIPPFHGSPDTTLGVELELQILDPETGDLVPGALRILDACAEEGIDGVSGEFLLSMLEVKTGVCADVAAVCQDMVSQLSRVHHIARSLGYDLAVGSTHPFSRTATAIFPDERYRRILNRQGWLAKYEAIFGMHVHVGVPDGERAIGLINLLTPYLPHLLALAANSPFWQGVDTDFASVRTVLFRPSPHTGIPQCSSGWQDFCAYCDVLHEGGVLENTKDLYWDIRPQPLLGTLEFRIFDTPVSLLCLLGLTALTRSLVAAGLEWLEDDPECGRGDPREFWLARENRWLASRYGLQAECTRSPGSGRKTLAEDVALLLERVMPVADDLGEARFLEVFQPVDRFETGAARRRRLYRQTGDWRVVLDDMRQGIFGEISEEIVSPSSRLISRTDTSANELSPFVSVPWPPAANDGQSAARSRVHHEAGWLPRRVRVL
jgi:carboxylate-amine ligase